MFCICSCNLHPCLFFCHCVALLELILYIPVSWLCEDYVAHFMNVFMSSFYLPKNFHFLITMSLCVIHNNVLDCMHDMKDVHCSLPSGLVAFNGRTNVEQKIRLWSKKTEKCKKKVKKHRFHLPCNHTRLCEVFYAIIITNGKRRRVENGGGGGDWWVGESSSFWRKENIKTFDALLCNLHKGNLDISNGVYAESVIRVETKAPFFICKCHEIVQSPWWACTCLVSKFVFPWSLCQY